MKKVLVLSIFLLCLAFFSQGQGKKIYIIGSSTAEGTGASAYQFSFAGRLAAYYSSDVFVNLALGGTTTYYGMPSTFVPPSGRPAPDLTRNITKAINEGADIILVSYPTNDIALGYTNAETLYNLSVMYQTAVNNNKAIYFLGTQPRNTLSPSEQQQDIDQNNAILATYHNSINVYPLLVAADGVSIATVVSAGDGIHVNNEGHRRIFQQIVDFNIFQNFLALPVSYITIGAEAIGKSVKISWQTSSELNNDYYNLERSADGSSFTPIATIAGKGNSNSITRYSYTDATPLSGKSYYRLVQVDIDRRKHYSKTVAVNSIFSASIRAYPVPASDMLNISVTVPKSESILINLIDSRGAVVSSIKRESKPGNNLYHIPVASLPRGQYVVNLISSSGNQRISFIRQ